VKRSTTRNETVITLGVAAIVVAFASLGLGCEPPDPDEEEYSDLCRVTEGTAQMAGNWVLRGSGSRSSCLDESYDGSFTIGTSQALRVLQTPGPAESDSDVIGLAGPILYPGGSFDLDGTVRGVCADFSTTEEGPSGRIVYRFSGTAADSGVIRGSFSGDGPSQCATTGTFSVVIQ
jgi:hypothetical protein